MEQREIKFKIEIDGEWHILDWKQLMDYAMNGNDMAFCRKVQYTGVKDKHGKEIFEGDIVKRIAKKMKENPTEADFDNKTLYDYHEEISFIEYRNNGFWIHDEDFGYEGEDLWDWEEIEVIGNLFENENLIQKKDEKQSS